MRPMLASLPILVAVSLASAQAPPTDPVPRAPTATAAAAPPSRRSLADGLVRQRIETDRLTAPHLTAGEDLGAGDGPLLLLVLHAKDGSGELAPLPRGHQEGDDLPGPQRPGSIDIAEPPPDGAPPAAPAPGAPQAAFVAIRRAATGFAIGTREQRDRLHVQDPGDATVRGLLQELLVGCRGTAAKAQLQIEPAADVPAAAVLTLWAQAHALGFTQPMFTNPAAGGGAAPIADATAQIAARLATIPREQQWPSRRAGNTQLFFGELLVLLDGDVQWHTAAQIYLAAARAGIWRIAFVGSDGRNRYKVPAPLPVDG